MLNLAPNAELVKRSTMLTVGLILEGAQPSDALNLLT